MLNLKLQYFGHLMGRTNSLKRPWCWERMKAGGEGDDRGWDGWMTSPTQWTWVLASSRKPGMLQYMGSQRVGHDWETELIWTEWSSGFPYFLQFKLEFVNKEFMIWATVSSRFVFADCVDLLRLCLKRILSIWFQYWSSGDVHMWSVLSCCWNRMLAMTSVFSWQSYLSLFPASFCTPRPNFPVTPGISWLPPFAFQSSIMKRTSFLGVCFRTFFLGLHRTVQLQFLQHSWSRHLLGLLWYWVVCLGNEQRSFCHFWDCIQELHFELLC